MTTIIIYTSAALMDVFAVGFAIVSGRCFEINERKEAKVLFCISLSILVASHSLVVVAQ